MENTFPAKGSFGVQFVKVKRHVYLLLLLLICINTSAAAQNLTLSGTVRDVHSGETLPYASVSLKGTDRGTATNNDGYFVLLDVPADSVTILVSYLGYQTAEFGLWMPDITGRLDIQLQPRTNELEGVTVESDKYTIMKMAENISQITISPKELAALPSLGEIDIFRSLQLLPGVSGTNEGSSGLYVRGGTPDQNLVLLDGMTIYHVDHFFGFFSAFNADAIKDVQLYKGGYPAKFGGRTSSVVELTGKTGDISGFRMGAGLNLLSASSVIEFPFLKRGAVLISARRSYTDVIRSGVYNQIFDLYDDTDDAAVQGPGQGGFGGGGRGPGQFGNAATQQAQPDFFFYDLNAKISYRPSNKDVLAVTLYNGKDDLDKSRDQSRTIGNNANLSIQGGTTDLTDWGNSGVSGKWSRQWSPRLYSNALIAYSEYFSDYYRFTDQEIRNPEADTLIRAIRRGSLEDNNINDFTLGLDNEWQAGKNHKVGFGAKLTRSDVSYFFSRDDTTTILDRNQSGQHSSVYVQDRWRILPSLELSIGGRASYYDESDETFLEPRVSASFDLTDRFKIKGAYGKFHQYVNRVVNENVSEGSRDFWLIADGETVEVSTSEHLIAGVSYDTGDYLFDVEAYRKDLQGLSEFSLRFQRTNFRSETASELFFSGNGVAKGIEFLAQKKTGQYTGWLSYTLANVDHTFPDLNEGVTFAALHDQQHEFKMVHNVELGRWNLSSTWVYSSGKPYTAPESEYTLTLLDGTEQTQIHIGEKNGLRLPDYHRLDLAANYSLDFGQSTGRIGLSLFNLYGRKNVWYREFDLTEGDLLVTDINYLGFIPNLQFRIDF
ncbi:MAG: TonB-dependent receptor [Rhodothermales bacterium]